jgi:hypothetical protein
LRGPVRSNTATVKTMGSLLLASFMVFAAFASDSSAQTGGARAFVTRPAADSFVISTTPQRNYGGSTTLRVDAAPLTRTYLRFDIRRLRGKVERATLRLYARSSSRRGIRVRAVRSDRWRERSITYTNAPRATALQAVTRPIRRRTWAEADVTALASRKRIFSVALTTRASARIHLGSRESRWSPRLFIQARRSVAPSTGTLFGSSAGARDGRTHAAELRYLERRIGRTFDLDHMYFRWDHAIPTPAVTLTVEDGRIPLVGWNAKRSDGAVTPWHEIASGVYDGWIRARADAFRELGSPVVIHFHHEPEDDVPLYGTPAEYAAAFRRVVSIFHERGATNVEWAWVMMAVTFDPGSGRSPETYYPGDDVVDWIGVDAYNWFGVRPGASWRELEAIISPFYAWASPHEKPLMVAEYGCREDPHDPLRKAQWLANAREMLKARSRFKAVVYWSGRGWQPDSSQPALAAYSAMGLDPYFNQP